MLQRKPGALRNGTPFTELPEAFRRLQAALLKQSGGPRAMVDVLVLVLQDDEVLVLSAVERALEASVPTKMHVVNILHRSLDGKVETPPPVRAPQSTRCCAGSAGGGRESPDARLLHRSSGYGRFR